MGIKNANGGILIVVVPGFYVSCCPAWRSQCQVSGHFCLETERPLLSPRFIHLRQEHSPERFPPGFSIRKHALRRSRRAMRCTDGISQAAGSLMCARSKICRKKPWRRSCNVTDWTSAGICWPALKPDESGLMTICFPIFSVPWTFLSSGSSPKKFETTTPNLPPAP